MKTLKHHSFIALLAVIAYAVQLLVVPVLLAAPTGLSSPTPGVSFSGVGTSNVTISSSAARSVVYAQGFDTTRAETVNVVQGNSSAMGIWIGSANPTSFDGTLNAMGRLFLFNPNGIVFGQNAQVNAAGLIASSLNMTVANFLAGHYLFTGTGIEGPVRNMGRIHGAYDGVYLLAPNVENSGVITTAGGSIVLAAGATAYLSNRPDGQGFLAEISAPAGSAVNLRDLIADGGHITMAGRVVNQEGLVQANSVRERNGKIELFASETLTLKAGSQTIAKGGSEGLSDGGTILAVADKLKGSATFEKGATLDVSGGIAGGHAGFVELSGSRVALGGRFVGTANPGFRPGRLLIDPTQDLDLTGFTATDFSNITFETPRDAFGNFLPDYDLRVTGYFDLNAVQPPGGGGTIRFEASRDLIFNDLLLWNNPVGTPARWDIVGVAERNILFTGNTGTTLQTAHGGGIELMARTGSVNLIDSGTGALSSVTTWGSGGISITTGRDLVASTGFDELGGPLGFYVQGISIEGSGRLNVNVGGNFIGGLANGVPAGPGFLLRNLDATGPLPQHTVNVAGRIGDTNLTLGTNGLPLTKAELQAQNRAPESESSVRYADFALSNGNLTVTAGGNVYLSRIRDAGLVGGLDPNTGGPRELAFAAGLENNKATIVSRDGNILINTNSAAAGRSAADSAESLSSLLPASFEARADNGSIQIRSNLAFLPSPTGSVSFSARNNIEGITTTSRKNDDTNFFWFFKGYGGLAGGQWVVVDRRTVGQNSDYWPFLYQMGGALPPEIENTRPSTAAPFPEYARRDVDSSPPAVKLLQVNPGDLAGNTALDQVSALVNQNRVLAPENPTALAPVSFIAELGNISKLFLDLVSRPFHKEVTIEAGNRIEQVSGRIYLPDLGTQTQTVTEHIPLILDPATNQPRPINNAESEHPDVVLIRDPITGVVRPWDRTEAVDPANLVNVVFSDVPVTVTSPRVAATIKAQDINLGKGDAGQGILAFSGPGTAQVIAKGTLDLANGVGISMERSQTGAQGGLLDIAVGNRLDMVTSSIITQNGAGVSIHGYDETRPYIVGYDNSALYPLEFPDSARGGINLPAVGGRVNVGENSQRSVGGNDAPTGIQVVEGGSVGYMARTATVNADGTVTVPVVRDPAAILIRAKGDIDVNKSRIATFGGGDIRITSTQGNINAGSGSRGDLVQFSIDTGLVDSQGTRIYKFYEVPGSGIFTYHPDDPRPLAQLFPTFSDPEINALLAQANREGFLGRDVSALNARANQLRAERQAVFNETVLSPFIDRLKLGNIYLTAEAGVGRQVNQVPADRGRIIIPEAGILGRDVVPRGILDFRGGAIVGRLVLPPSTVFIGAPNIPVLAPPGLASPPPALSGGGTAGAASTTSAASATGVKQSDAAQESAVESSSQSRETKEAKKNDGKSAATQVAKSVRVKRGVVIQVDVKPQAQSGS